MSTKVSRPVLRGPGPSNGVRLLGVKADVAALLTFLVLCGFRHISGENFALGSLRSDDWQLGRPTAPPLLSVFRVFSPPNASALATNNPGLLAESDPPRAPNAGG